MYGNSNSNFWKELVKLILIAVVVVVPFRLYVAQPFIVDGLSMYPTFNNGHYLIIDEISYRFKTPERGSVIVFKPPRDPGKYFIKRVIGLPGETVRIENGQVTIINAENPDGFTLDEPYVELTKEDNMSFILSDGEYFVMGDNRSQSADSRIWGAVPEANIIGRPIIRFFPPTLFPGNIAHFQNINNQNE
jgi:signal peptidase I